MFWVTLLLFGAATAIVVVNAAAAAAAVASVTIIMSQGVDARDHIWNVLHNRNTHFMCRIILLFT